MGDEAMKKETRLNIKKIYIENAKKFFDSMNVNFSPHGMIET